MICIYNDNDLLINKICYLLGITSSLTSLSLSVHLPLVPSRGQFTPANDKIHLHDINSFVMHTRYTVLKCTPSIPLGFLQSCIYTITAVQQNLLKNRQS